MRRAKKDTPAARAGELIWSGIHFSGVLWGLLKSPGVGFTLAMLAAGGAAAAVLIRKSRREETLSIR